MLVPCEIRCRGVSFSKVFLFHPFTPVREIDLPLWRAFGIKLRFGDRFVHGKPIRQKKKKKKGVSKHTDTYAWGLISTFFYFLYKKKFHYSCLNSKSLLSSIFYTAFSFFVHEFPACWKLGYS